MKYIIAHLIRGEAKHAHEMITKDLVSKFDVFPIHDRISPHLTIKRWFEIDEKGLDEIKKKLDIFCAAHTQSDYELKGFGHFGKDVIYVDALPSEKTLQTIRELMTLLKEVPDLVFDEYDEVQNDLHATVVMEALKPFNFDEVWNYLQNSEQPNFHMKFDNLTLERRDENKWVLEKVWELPSD